MSRKALVVGISNYKNSAEFRELGSAANDAQVIYELLCGSGFNTVTPLPAAKADSESHFQAKVKKDGEVKANDLISEMKDLFCGESAKSTETALLFFSGHGTSVYDVGYLVVTETNGANKAVPFSTLIDILNDSPVHNKIVFLDCCYSGLIALELHKHQLTGNNIFIIAASNKKAFVDKSGIHGLLSEALIEGLDPVKQQKEEITLSYLQHIIEKKMDGKMQEPIFLGSKSNLVITRAKLNNTYPKPNNTDLKKSVAQTLLPYMPDRDKQEGKIERAIRNIQKSDSKHPLLCVTHGDEQQSHDKFVERLEERLKMSIDLPKGKVKIYVWPVPLQEPFKDYDSFYKVLLNGLSKVIVKQSLKSPEEINEILNCYDMGITYTVFDIDGSPSDKKDDYLKILKYYVEFWGKWPKENLKTLFLSCLLFKYKRQKTSFFSGIFKKNKTDNIENIIETKLTKLCSEFTKECTLADPDFLCLGGCTFSLLPPLTDVTKGEAEDWARSEYVRNDYDVENSRLIIRRIYDEWEAKHKSDKIPMEHLAKLLREKIL
ncbi:MAG: caspase family protein [Nitrospirae bacterium]|nr:caspase family protein [Nitrospirota bacterium]MBF0535187.1 caspase family protein [Nitrospirota bacterium]MBF0615194.1 caspase family protein [Nitrospirota bacterium]